MFWRKFFSEQWLCSGTYFRLLTIQLGTGLQKSNFDNTKLLVELESRPEIIHHLNLTVSLIFFYFFNTTFWQKISVMIYLKFLVIKTKKKRKCNRIIRVLRVLSHIENDLMFYFSHSAQHFDSKKFCHILNFLVKHEKKHSWPKISWKRWTY